MKVRISANTLVRIKCESGFTLLELILTVAIIAIVLLAGAQLLSPIVTFMRNTPARQGAQMEMRSCLDTIERVMSNGKAGTLVIATPPTTPTLQFSSATFQSQDGSTYTICWSTSPANSVHLQRTFADGTVNDSVLARHITTLVFGFSGNDPGIVSVTLQMTVLLDSSGSPGSLLTISPPTQTIRMVSL